MSVTTEQASNLTKWQKQILSHQRDARALYLLEHGFRTSIIQIETGLFAGRIRDLSRGISGLAGDSLKLSPGMLQESERILQTRAATAEGTLFILTYAAHAGHQNAKQRIDIDAVIAAHKLLTENRAKFGSFFTSQPLEINQCWVLARDFRSPIASIPPKLQLRRCTDCGSPYLSISTQTKHPCPFCTCSLPDTMPQQQAGA